MSRGVLYDALNPISGVHTRIVKDALTGLPMIETRQNTDAIVEFNKRLARAMDPHAARARRAKNSGLVHVASVPMVIWQMLVKAGITRDPKALNQWLSRRDTRLLRVDDGRRLA